MTFSAPQVLVLDVILGKHLLQLMRHLLCLPTGQAARASGWHTRSAALRERQGRTWPAIASRRSAPWSSRIAALPERRDELLRLRCPASCSIGPAGCERGGLCPKNGKREAATLHRPHCGERES